MNVLIYFLLIMLIFSLGFIILGATIVILIAIITRILEFDMRGDNNVRNTRKKHQERKDKKNERRSTRAV